MDSNVGKQKRNTSGIYKILNKINGKFYIGSSCDIGRRWNAHLLDLVNKKHYNKYLQNSFNTHGKDSFEFSILEECEKEKLIEREQYYLDSTQCYKKEIGYNVCLRAENCLGVKRTEEVKMAISLRQRGELSCISKLTWECVREIRKLYYEGWSLSRLAEKYYVDIGTILPVIQNKTWKDESYTYVRLGKKGRVEKGEERYNSRFTQEIIKEIRRLYKEEGLSTTELGKKYNANRTSIVSIVLNQSWRDENYVYVKNPKYTFSEKLSYQDVLEIRRLYKLEMKSYIKLAEKFNVSEGTIRKIVLNKTWKDEKYEKEMETLVKGIGKPKNKYSVQLANAIRERYSQGGVLYEDLEKQFNTPKAIIGRMIRNEIYIDKGYNE